MLSDDDYPHLRRFIASSFRPDSFEVAFTYTGIVNVALAGWGPNDALCIDADIDDVLASGASNHEIARWLEDAGLGVVLEAEGYTPRSFLEMIAARLRRHVRRHRFGRSHAAARKA